MLCDTQEKLVEALETLKSVEILNKDEFLHGKEFCRTLEIFVNGCSYTIQWYKNLSTISSVDIFSAFDSISEGYRTYPLPSDSKLTVQFSNNGHLAVII